MGQATPPVPVEVEHRSADAEFRVTWDDGRLSVYPLAYLRGFCPCASCQGHGGQSWTYVESPEGLTLEKIEEVGHYALGLTWSDGHSTGIYSWAILRQLCPSEESQAELGARHPIHKYNKVPQ